MYRSLCTDLQYLQLSEGNKRNDTKPLFRARARLRRVLVWIASEPPAIATERGRCPCRARVTRRYNVFMLTLTMFSLMQRALLFSAVPVGKPKKVMSGLENKFTLGAALQFLSVPIMVLYLNDVVESNANRCKEDESVEMYQ